MFTLPGAAVHGSRLGHVHDDLLEKQRIKDSGEGRDKIIPPFTKTDLFRCRSKTL
jgi:hypothetical protein